MRHEPAHSRPCSWQYSSQDRRVIPRTEALHDPQVFSLSGQLDMSQTPKLPMLSEESDETSCGVLPRNLFEAGAVNGAHSHDASFLVVMWSQDTVRYSSTLSASPLLFVVCPMITSVSIETHANPICPQYSLHVRNRM